MSTVLREKPPAAGLVTGVIPMIFRRVEDLDDKEREYIVVSMTLHSDTSSASRITCNNSGCAGMQVVASFQATR